MGSRFLTIVLVFFASFSARAEDDVGKWTRLLRQARGSTGLPIRHKQEILVDGMEVLKRAIKRDFTGPIEEYRRKLSGPAAGGKESTTDDALRRLLFDETPEAKTFRARLLACRDPKDAASCGLRNLYSETNYLASALISDGQFDRCGNDLSSEWIRDQGLTQSVLAAQGQYRPHCEGAGSRKSYTLIQEKKKQPGDEAKLSGWPMMYGGDHIGELLNQSDAIIRKSYVDAPANYLGKKFPPQGKLSDEEYAGIKMKEEMKEAIYERAVTNSLKTKFSFQRFFGQKSYGDITREISAEVRQACRHCTDDARSAIEKRTLNAVYRAIPEERSDFFRDPRNVVMKLCQDLGKAGYYGSGYKPELALLEANDFAEAERKSLRNQPMRNFDPAMLRNVKFEQKSPEQVRMEWQTAQIANSQAKQQALSRLVMQGDQGLLMLTDAMTAKDDRGGAKRIHLRCESTPDEVAKDVALVQSALKEADGKLGDYLKKINDETKPLSGFTKSGLVEQERQLRALVKDNAIAAGEALAENPLSTGVICHTLNGIYREQLAKGERKALFQAALLIANVATLGIASVPTAIIGSLVLTGIGVVDKVVIEANETSAEQRDVLNALYAGQSENLSLRDRNSELLSQYESLRFDWADSFDIAMGAVDGMQLFRALAKTIKTPGEMAEATRILRQRRDASGIKRQLTTQELETEILAIHRELLQGADPTLAAAELQRLKQKYPKVQSKRLEEYAKVKRLGEGVLDGRKLSESEADFLFEAHLVGGDKTYGEYTVAELLQKRRLLDRAGFTPKEAQQLLIKGVAGNARADLPVQELAGVYRAQMSTDRLNELAKLPTPDLQQMLKDMVVDLQRLKGCETLECRKAVRNITKDYDELRSVGYFSIKGDDLRKAYQQSTPKFAELDLSGKAADAKGAAADPGHSIQVTAAGDAAKGDPARTMANEAPAHAGKPLPGKPIPKDFDLGNRLVDQTRTNLPARYADRHKKMPEIRERAGRIAKPENPVAMADLQSDIADELAFVAESNRELEKSMAKFDELAPYEGSLDSYDLKTFKTAQKNHQARTQLLEDLRNQEKFLLEERQRIADLQKKWGEDVIAEPSRYVRRLERDKEGRLILSMRRVAEEVPPVPIDKLERYLQSVETSLARGQQRIVRSEDKAAAAEALFKLVNRGDVDVRYFPEIRKRVEDQLGKIDWNVPEGSKFLDKADEMAAVQAAAAKALPKKRVLTEAEKQGLLDAHLVGRFELGKDGVATAHKGDKARKIESTYTREHLAEKTRILRKAGFTEDEATKLIREGVAGDAPSVELLVANRVEGTSEAGIVSRTPVMTSRQPNFVRVESGSPPIFVSSNPHVTRSHFYMPAIKNEGKDFALKSGKKLSTHRRVQFEKAPAGSGDVEAIRVYRKSGSGSEFVGEIPVRDDGFDIPFLSHGDRKDYSFEFVSRNGSSERKTTQDLLESAPPGFRHKLNAQDKQFRKSGFAGGHTETSWQEVERVYGDRVRVRSDESPRKTIKLPGSDRAYVFQSMRYDIDGVAIPTPKVIFKGSDREFSEFEHAIAPMVQKALKSAPRNAYEIRLPVEGGDLVVIRYPIKAGDPNSGKVYSWYMDLTTAGGAK